MGKSGQHLSAGLSVAFLLIWLSSVLSSCAGHRVVVLEDTLTAEEHNDLGYAYEQKGLADLAEKEYLLALKKRKAWSVPCFNLGNLAFAAGRYEKAEQYFRKALRLDPDNPDGMNNLANALLRQDRLPEARTLVERALRSVRKSEYLDTLEEIRRRDANRSP